MCGIVGSYGPLTDRDVIQRMNDAQAHRGPDGEGILIDGPVGLGHRRLSIIDVAHGQQPMATADGRFHLSYNGEVYNYLELRAELEADGRTFTTDSDTEVVLQAFAAWGPAAFDRFNGMWGLAIWDREQQRLTLSRDHFGIKPVYVARLDQGVLFASEIRAIIASGCYRARPDETSLFRYLKFRIHEEGERTFFEGIERLGPGEMMTIDAHGVRREAYTRLPQELAELAREQRPYDAAAAAEFEARFRESIRLRLQSEVPVGTSLSGGLDSSAVAVVINQMLGGHEQTATISVGARQNTFSAVFPGSLNDEEKYVDAVLERCQGKVAAHKITPTVEDFRQDLEDFVRTQEEPMISSGPYAQYQVMREATEHVTVLLDGQGADEEMAGYVPYYLVYLRQLRRQNKRAAARELATSIDVLARLGRFTVRDRLKGRRATPVTTMLATSFVDAHRGEGFTAIQDDLKRRLIQDIFHNSLPSLLRYEDKNTMRFSLEGRVPFLDKELLKFIFSLSDEAIIKGGWNKRILRDATDRLLPRSINRRRNKIGFTTPQGEWFLRLKDVFEDVFTSDSFASRPYFDQQEVLTAFRAWVDSDGGTGTMTFWRLLNVELWLREFVDEQESVSV